MHWDNCHGTYTFPNVGKYVENIKRKKTRARYTNFFRWKQIKVWKDEFNGKEFIFIFTMGN